MGTLDDEGYIQGGQASFIPDAWGFDGSMFIDLTLTEFGEKNKDDIISMVFNYLNVMSENGVTLAHFNELKDVFSSTSITTSSIAYDPFNKLIEIPKSPKERYKIMTSEMPKGGKLSLDMMYKTAGIQMNYDYTSEEDFEKKFKIGNYLAPLTIAIFANSPFDNSKILLKHIDDGMALANKDSKSNKTASPPYKKDEETGNIQFNFKCKASGVSKTGQNWEQKPKVFDSKGTPIAKDILVWGGTTMKVAYEIIPYSNNMLGSGVSLRLKAVQVHDLVSGGGASADSYGFKEEADGYVAETTDSFPEAEVNGQEDF